MKNLSLLALIVSTMVATELAAMQLGVKRAREDAVSPKCQLSGSGEGAAQKERECLDDWLDLNSVDGHGVPPLHFAASEGKIRAAQLLIERGAIVNAKDSTGQTPLHVAVARNDIAMVAKLLEKGADVGARDNHTLTTPIILLHYMIIVKYYNCLFNARLLAVYPTQNSWQGFIRRYQKGMYELLSAG